jgi:DNA-binding PadR family transcriptional regulator
MYGEMAYPGRAYDRGREDEWRRARRRWIAMMTGARRHGGHYGHHGRRRFGGGFEPWGAGRFPGPFFGRGPKVGRGDVRAAILVLLAEGPMHGYQIIQELGERSGGMWRPSPGSVYPTLQMLEDQGLVAGEESEGRRVFGLTEAGKAEAAKRGEGSAAPWEMGDAAGPLVELRDVGFGLMTAVMQIVQTGDERQIGRAKDLLNDARKSLYRLLAEDDPDQRQSSSS